MWKSSVGANNSVVIPSLANGDDDDDWETDPDYVNEMSEEQQRWGGARDTGVLDMDKFREEVQRESNAAMKKKASLDPQASMGYGGKFGVESDRMDKSALGHDYQAPLVKHASQKDYATGFGGKYGVQKGSFDQSALGWDHIEKVDKHDSQIDYKSGFGGKFGVQNDRGYKSGFGGKFGVQTQNDKSALGWDHVEKVEKHDSQKDYKDGFGGQFGVQADRVDKSALGWEHHEKLNKHESQKDYAKGFGGKFGVQTDRKDKSALSYDDQPDKIGTNYERTRPEVPAKNAGNLR